MAVTNNDEHIYAGFNVQRKLTLLALSLLTPAALAAPVPSYVPPVVSQQTQAYVGDEYGVFVPQHMQHRHATVQEQQRLRMQLAQQMSQGDSLPSLADGQNVYSNELDRIAADPGLLAQPAAGPADNMAAPNPVAQMSQPLMVPQAYPPMQFGMAGGATPMVVPVPVPFMAPMQQQAMVPATTNPSFQLANGGQMLLDNPVPQGRALDMHNALVSLREDRITVRRALQRMMDQIGAGGWVVVWDLAETNAGLPETEISIHAEEPFMAVLNALLARVQARSGQPLRVIRYDRTQRLVVTDRAPGDTMTTARGDSNSTIGDVGEAAVTENVLRESIVSLHYDEIPLVDALENIVHQAGKGQWRLRMYGGVDQVLKPAHIEEPFGIAVERLLKLFNLKYEIFPGGKLIVVTQNNRFGFN